MYVWFQCLVRMRMTSKIKRKDSVLTPGTKRIAIEAGVGDGWYKYVGIDGGLVV